MATKLTANMSQVLAYHAKLIGYDVVRCLANHAQSEAALTKRGFLERTGTSYGSTPTVTDAGWDALVELGYPDKRPAAESAPTMHVRTEGATVTACGQDATAVGATPVPALVDCSDCVKAVPPATLNDFESVPRCAFCGQPYDECVCEYPPASVSLAKRSAPYLNDFEDDEQVYRPKLISDITQSDIDAMGERLERKLAERRAAGGATFEQRAEIVRLAAGRNVSAELEPAVTAATASDGVLAYELAQDTISQLLRAPRTDLDFSDRVLAYRRQNGWSPRLTARQSRRLNKKMRRELAR